MNKVGVIALAAFVAVNVRAGDAPQKGKGDAAAVAPVAPVRAGGAHPGQARRFNGAAGLPAVQRLPANSQFQPGLNRSAIWRLRQIEDLNRLNAAQNGGEARVYRRRLDPAQDTAGTRDDIGMRRLPPQDRANARTADRDTNATNANSTDKVTNAAFRGRGRGTPVVSFNNNGPVNNFDDACRRHRHHHDRDWWCHNFSTIILIGGGYYAWDAGWWYPALGYDSSYASYSYDGPIYGYDGLPPDQVISNVQGALQELGYFPYAVDGLLGPVTQQAIAAYQADNGLYASGAIDRATLVSLGFIY